ncbi:MAG: hypothetical protein ACK5AM_16540 [Pirellulaceae bacterium]|jgi:hypothetical protein
MTMPFGCPPTPTKCLGLLLSLLLFPLLIAPSQGEIIELYSGSGLPSLQPWLSYADDRLVSGGTVSQTTVSGGVRLATDLPVSAGYSNHNFLSQLKNPNFPELVRSQGFQLAFRTQILSEQHGSIHRAGWSVLLLGQDRKGVELGFWENEIWAQTQSPLFQHGEGVTIDTRITRDYRLQILGDRYALAADGLTILEGDVKDYSSFGTPYSLPNFLFLGDNTSSAGGAAILGSVSLQTGISSIPEPSSIAFVSGAIIYFRTRSRRRSNPAASDKA